ncbi:MAG: cadherin repeat domain-containing protein, partial [Thermoleophilia bacterium]|nr:cadherin repeat domain-containing protein [Thermoleophilia bacterium]
DPLESGDVFVMCNPTGFWFIGALYTTSLPALSPGLGWDTSNLSRQGGWLAVVETSDPTITVDKSGPASVPEGQTATYTFAITNTSLASSDPVIVTSVVDDVLGDLTATAQAAWISQGHTGDIVLAPGATFTFTYTTGPLGVGTVTNTVTVTGHDDENLPATDSDTHTLAVTNVNDPPAFTSAAEFFVVENNTFVTRLAALDPDGDDLLFSIAGGVDASLFGIDPRTQSLRFLAAPDYERPADAGKNNIYDLIVRVSDGVATATQALVVHVTDLAEVPPSHSPVITSDGGLDTAAFNIPENTTAVTTVQATDPDVGAALTFSIMGGPDADKFHIDPQSGALSFITPPDYERPSDVGRDNVCRITVRVSDGANADTQVLTITVTDVVEQTPPPVTNRWNDITDAEWPDTYGVSAAEVDRVADGGSDGNFRPTAIITRGQFAKMVVDGFEIARATTGPATFSDVPLSHVFFAWIEGGADAGVLSGLESGAFAPAGSITRQQAATILGRHLVARELAATGSIKGTQSTYPSLEAWFAAEGGAVLAPFADAEALATVHAPYTAYLVHAGVMQGSALGGASYLLPLGNLTRAQAAAMIVRAGKVSFAGS